MGDGKCRIPLSHIEIGVELTEDLKVVSDSGSAHPSLNLAALGVQTSISSTVLGKYLQGFVASMLTIESRGLLKICGVPAVIVEIIDKPNKQSLLLNKFLEGMKLCDSLDVFKNGMPLHKEIWDKCKALDPSSAPRQLTHKGTYFYLLMYYNEETNEAAFYLGRTKDLALRHVQHSKALESENLGLLHYRMARRLIAEGATHRLFPITFISDDIPNANVHCAWAETILISTFESFNPVMLGWRNHSPSKVVLENIPDWGRSAQQDGYLRTYTRPCALMILEIASQIKNSDSSLQKLKIRGPFTGLNWCVPLAEGLMHEANMWIGTKIPSVDDMPAMWSFRTQPKRLTARRGVGILYGSRKNSQPVRLRRIMPVEEGRLVPGSIINVVLEIMIDAEIKHPYSYLQLPAIGPLDCWSEAFRLAIRIEFEDEGKWYSKYLTQASVIPFSSRYKNSKQPDDPAYGINNIDVDWIHAIKTVSALLNWRWQPDNALSRRVWSPYVTRTRTMEFDFFNQQLVIGTLPITDKQCPRVLTLDETSDLIEAEFGLDVNIGHLPSPILVQDPEGGNAAAKRNKCDLCYVAKNMKLSRRCLERAAVTTVDGIELLQCPLSVLLGRYCTFTDGIEHREDLRGLVFQQQSLHPTYSIDPPPNMFQYLEIRESTAGEAVEDEEGE
ncbi:hypothetical protein FGRMN_9317 [Fusarium graminum]|nr:hypothetical protein FGRMN_9317 [Fusarium graminum]